MRGGGAGILFNPKIYARSSATAKNHEGKLRGQSVIFAKQRCENSAMKCKKLDETKRNLLEPHQTLLETLILLVQKRKFFAVVFFKYNMFNITKLWKLSFNCRKV